ncbi:MAG TPA: arylsulfotransferase family protein [Gemmataceae bacterium]|nr:arylsulfotransferase family protein [Gemmataceae bacterium]
MIRLRLPTINQVLAVVFVAGLAGLSYLFGAAVMHFRLPSSDFLYNAFIGAKAWNERGRPSDSFVTPGGDTADLGVRLDKPEKTQDGFTLCTTTQGVRAELLDMRGTVVHRWELPFGRVWKEPAHVRGSIPEEQIHWFRCHLFRNGDLLAVYHAEGDTPYGYGLVKLDKDSRLLWSYAGNAHHDVDVAEDGTIYTLTQKIETQPPEGLAFLPAPYLADSVVVLSAEGRELNTVPLLEAFRDSPYALLLTAVMNGPPQISAAPPPGPPRAIRLTPPGPGGPPSSGSSSPSLQPKRAGPTLSAAKGDFIHANSIKVLPRALASKFSLFQPGQVLISLRNLDAIAVLDLHKRSIVWAARGLWRIQHDAEFLANGHLLLFDNGGSIKGCRVIEFDPVRQALPWCYASEQFTPFSALFRGMKQGLSNGNVLIVDPDGGRIFEVTPDKEMVWEMICPRSVTGAHRYKADELTFLKAAIRARP